MKYLAKGLNMHIITWMKEKSIHSLLGDKLPGSVLHYPYESLPFLYSLAEPVPLVNFHMPEFHMSHTLNHYTLRSLNPAFLLPFQNFILQSPNICTTICHKVCLPNKVLPFLSLQQGGHSNTYNILLQFTFVIL